MATQELPVINGSHGAAEQPAAAPPSGEQSTGAPPAAEQPGTEQPAVQKPAAEPGTAQTDCDVLIVGAGFGGVYLLHRLRDELGLKVKVFEQGTDVGGIWHWNCYPGARVDSPVPVYEYSFPKVWKNWTWTQKYPGWRELRQYFDHVDRELDIRKDISFGCKVNDAHYDKEQNVWTVQTESGKTARATYFIVAVGFAAKRHYPEWKGLDTFKGELHHSSYWPQGGVDVDGKRVAVVGTGATGIQLSQELARTAGELTLFQRTPNLCLPMKQRPMTAEEQVRRKDLYDDLFKERLDTFAGFPYTFFDQRTLLDSPAERQAFFEYLWQRGGFNFWLATYGDAYANMEANREHYDFWLYKTRARITDPKKRDLLCPAVPPHPWGTKRPSLEQDFYEQMDKPHVKIVDVNATPVREVVPEGIVTEDGVTHKIDVLALATGFDSVTGGMKNMGLHNVDGQNLGEVWKNGTYSYLGLTCNGFPNMFFLYGAQGPTAFSNGPTCVEVQGDWIVSAIAQMRKEGVRSIEATPEAVQGWYDLTKSYNDKTLFPLAKSWYMGANIPGKPLEALNFTGGFPIYRKEIAKGLDNWQGFHVVKA